MVINNSTPVLPAVSLNNLIFRWSGQQKIILDIPNFEVAAGEHIFIEGPSGSGKSTLLGLIAGILSPSIGTVTVNGIGLNNLSLSKRDIFRGDYIGCIFQQFNLIPYLSVMENVLIPCHLSRIRHQQAKQQASDPHAAARMLLERLDLSPDLWCKTVSQLSVGQQQRVAAARALIGKPSIVIADEPTSSLDANRRKAFLSLLLKECKETGSTLFFVSHDQALAEEFPVNINLNELNKAKTAKGDQG